VNFKWQLKIIFFLEFFCFLLFQATFTPFFKDKKVIKKSQNTDPDTAPGGPKTYGIYSKTSVEDQDLH
jgi:hypothetical protein